MLFILYMYLEYFDLVNSINDSNKYFLTHLNIIFQNQYSYIIST